MTNRCRAGQPCNQPLPPIGEQVAKELHSRYFKELPVQMHEPELSLRDKFLKLIGGNWK